MQERNQMTRTLPAIYRAPLRSL